jgi:hypothetical protein
MVVIVDGVAYFHKMWGGGEEPDGVELGPADQVRRAGRDRVWLIDPPPEEFDPHPTTAVRLVDAAGGEIRSFEMPGRWVAEVTRDLVVLQRGGRVYTVDEDGLRATSVGWVLGMNGDAAIVLTCDEDGVCSLQRQPLDGGRPEVIEEVGDPDSMFFAGYAGPDGQMALLRSNPRGSDQQLQLFDPDGHDLGTVDVTVSSVNQWVQWLPDGLGLLVATGRGIEWAKPNGDGWSLEPVELGAVSQPELFFVVSP